MKALDAILDSLQTIIAPELDTLLRAYGAEIGKVRASWLEQILSEVEDFIAIADGRA